MPMNKADIAIAKAKSTGAIWVDPGNGPIPTDANAALPTTAVSLGYIGAEGVANQVEVSETDIEDMNGEVVSTVVDSSKENVNFDLLQVSAEGLKELYGAENVV